MGDFMKKIGAVIAMGIISLIAVGMFGAVSVKSVTGCFSNSNSQVSSSAEIYCFNPFLGDDNTFKTDSKSSSISSDAVQVLSEEYAKGKVITKFLTPYSAGLKSDNIYIKNNTGVDINIKSELSYGVKIKLENTESPEVLIVHTHATESYMSGERDYYTDADIFNTTDATKNVIKIGDIVKNILEQNGISVSHDTTLHDGPAYSGSYSRAEQTIKNALKKYPSIKIVLDIHRDSVTQNSTDRVRPIININGRDAAQVMLVMGSNTGSVSDFDNWKENLRLALLYQQKMEQMYPGLARAMLLASKKYNQHLTTGSMLLEVGTDANTFEQAEYAATLAANALSEGLKELG